MLTPGVTHTRIAPSPSGFLHLGNAVNFLLARWVADAEPGSRVDLRIDDLGLPVRPDHLADVFWALDWLGIPISAGPVDPDDFWRGYAQRDAIDRFRAAAASLGPEWTYACECSRTIVARRAPGVADPCADSQIPWGLDAVGGQITQPAWKSKPSWYLQVADDKMIPLPAQQAMSKRAGSTIVEVPGSHAIFVSNPKAVAAIIEKAASGVK